MPTKKHTWMKVVAVCLIALSIYCIYKGFDCKNNYYNSDFSIRSTNAYVGGDAYNYIINGTYFTGYVTLGGLSGLGAIILLCSYANMSKSDKNEDEGNNTPDPNTDDKTYQEPSISNEARPTHLLENGNVLLPPVDNE